MKKTMFIILTVVFCLALASYSSANGQKDPKATEADPGVLSHIRGMIDDAAQWGGEVAAKIVRYANTPVGMCVILGFFPFLAIAYFIIYHYRKNTINKPKAPINSKDTILKHVGEMISSLKAIEAVLKAEK